MLDVREQVYLSFKRMLEICLDSISYRLLRSFVTVMIITLAIAFLSTIMFQGYLGRSIRDAAIARTARATSYSHFLTNASLIDADEKLVSRFAWLTPGTAQYENVKRWGEFDEAGIDKFVKDSRQLETYLNFFQEIQIGRRVLLVGRFEGLAIFDWLMKTENVESFRARLKPMTSLRFPGKPGEFDSFLTNWPAYRKRFERVKRNYAAVIERIRKFSEPQGLRVKLDEAVSAGRAAAFFKQLADLGYQVDPKALPNIEAGVRYESKLDWALSFLKKQPVRTGWPREFKEKFNPGAALKSCAATPSRITWIQETLDGGKLGKGFDPAKFVEVAEAYAVQSRLLEARERLVNRYGRTQKLGEKTIWLITVSFLVCVVGIANAMLMSVLERFKEIATMKCLGARNETIRFLFITESMIIGVVGGVVGMILGFLVALIRQSIAYGGLVFENFPFGDMFTTFWICAVCSLLLAAIAAIFPSGVAARMAPMEAMRVD